MRKLPEKKRANQKKVSCKKCGQAFEIDITWNRPPEYCRECAKQNQSNWKTQEKNKDFHVEVSGSYVRNDDRERTDFIIRQRGSSEHEHFSVGEDSDWEVVKQHD